MLRNEWLAHLDGLVVFRGLLAAEPLRALRAALAAEENELTGAIAALEAELKDAINGLGLGAAGTGGDTVCLALKMERAHTHTAIAPVAINFHCWVARRAGIRIYDDGRVEKLL